VFAPFAEGEDFNSDDIIYGIIILAIHEIMNKKSQECYFAGRGLWEVGWLADL